LRLYREERPRAVLVAWDTLNVPTYRHEKFPAYQGGREFDDPLLEQLEVLPEFVAACGFQNAKAPGFEADDFLASAAAKEERGGGTVLIASGDRDTFQLASDRTIILYPVRAGEMARIGPAEVRARYGVDPKQVPDFIALRGDPSDKVPGAPGVGATGAATLLQSYGSLEAALTAGRFPAMAKSLRLFRSIATMNRKSPLIELALASIEGRCDFPLCRCSPRRKPRSPGGYPQWLRSRSSAIGTSGHRNSSVRCPLSGSLRTSARTECRVSTSASQAFGKCTFTTGAPSR
jgi:DNA polymerase I